MTQDVLAVLMANPLAWLMMVVGMAFGVGALRYRFERARDLRSREPVRVISREEELEALRELDQEFPAALALRPWESVTAELVAPAPTSSMVETGAFAQACRAVPELSLALGCGHPGDVLFPDRFCRRGDCPLGVLEVDDRTLLVRLWSGRVIEKTSYIAACDGIGRIEDAKDYSTAGSSVHEYQPTANVFPLPPARQPPPLPDPDPRMMRTAQK